MNTHFIMADTTRRALSWGILLIALLGALSFVLTQPLSLWDFRNNLWGPAHLLVTGRGPYDVSLYYFNSNAVWMPPIIGALFPIGYLPEAVASSLWLLLSLASLGGLYALLDHPAQPALWRTALALIAILILPVTIGHLVLGQVSALIGVLLLLAVRQLARGHYLATGALLALAAAKPQLLVLPALGLAMLALHRDGWRGLLKLMIASAAWAALFTLPLWIGYPDWVAGWWRSLQNNPAWAHPSTLVLLRSVLGNAPGIAVWALFGVAVIALHTRIWWRGLRADKPDHIGLLCFSFALNLLIVPYVWTWDFVLCLPLLLLIWTRLRTRLALVVFGVAFGAAWAATVAVRLTTDGNDVRFWFVPWMLLAAAGLGWLADRRKPVGQMTPTRSSYDPAR